MKNITLDVSRRQVLRGLGGFTLALPFLPSLVTPAYAQATFVRRPHLFFLTNEHGAAWEANFFPDPAGAVNKVNLYADHVIGSGPLASTVNGANTVVSPVLSARSTALTPRMVSKMNVLRGLDIPFYLGHSRGAYMGNYAYNDGNGSDGVAVRAFPRATVEQLTAWSPSFYPDIANIRERVMLMGSNQHSFMFSNAAAKTGTITAVAPQSSSLTLFNRIFVQTGPTPTPTPVARTPVVDRVLESYRSLRNGNRRLSAEDKVRLDDHMDRLAELQRKLQAGAGGGTVTRPASCSTIVRPTDDANRHGANTPGDAARQGQLFNDVVVAAFACGSSRVAVQGLYEASEFLSYAGDWHQNIAHQWQSPTAQASLRTAYQGVFETIFLDLATKLDAVETAPGFSLLDDSLLIWVQESGMATHDSFSLPVVTLGSAAGYFKTGLNVDYRRNNNNNSRVQPGVSNTYLGILYSQFLATVARSMGLPPSEFELWGHKGVGAPYVGNANFGPPYSSHYLSTSSRYFTAASDPLPLITG